MASLPNRRFDPPIPTRSFVETTDFNNLKEKIQRTNVVVVSGRSGSGKTTTARQTIAEMCSELPGDCDGMWAKIMCSNPEVLNESVTTFLSEYGIELKTKPKHFGESWVILRHFYKELDKKYPSCKKYFLLDDATAENEFYDVIDDIAKCLKKLEPDACSSWKLIVTTRGDKLKPRRYKCIGESNFVKFTGFTVKDATSLYNMESDDGADQRDLVQQLHDKLGSLPLALSVAIKDLDFVSEFETPERFVRDYLSRLQHKTEMMQRENRGKDKTLAACELSIEKCVDDVAKRTGLSSIFYKKFIRLLSCFNEDNIPGELLKSCAEALLPEDPENAADGVGKLMKILKLKGLCIRTDDKQGNMFFSMHALIQMAMKTVFFNVEDIDEQLVFTKALTALTRVIPKDGRQHNPLLPAYYFHHGQSIIKAIDDSQTLNDDDLITLLQCDLFISLGYCLVSRKDSEGEKYFDKALNKFCLLVTKSSYDELLKRFSTRYEIVSHLYEEGKQIPLRQSASYLEFIDELPEFHVLTQTSLGNMADIKEEDLLNRHLKKNKLKSLRDHGNNKIIQPKEKLAAVYIGEMLGQIFFGWNKVFAHLDLPPTQANPYIEHAKIALLVYNKILEDEGVYLLPALITERHLLCCKLTKATSCSDADAVVQAWESLSNICRYDQSSKKNYAYECGLLKSYLVEDDFHKLLCKEGRLYALGVKYEQTNPNDEDQKENVFQEGTRLFEEILNHLQAMISQSQSCHNHQAMSKSYQHYAKFLKCCKKWGLAIKALVRSMNELASLPAELDPMHISFNIPYSYLKTCYDLYKENKEAGSYLFTEEDPEPEMIRKIIKSLESSRFPCSLTSDSNCLCHIEENEVKRIIPQTTTTDAFNEVIRRENIQGES